jgi:hypothetical protein
MHLAAFAVLGEEAVDVVLDDPDAVAGGELGEGFAAVARPDRAGGVLVVRDDVDGARRVVADRVFEGLDGHAVAVHGEALEADAEEAREVFHSRICEFVAEDDVAGAADRQERGEHSVLRAVVDDQAVGGHRHAVDFGEAREALARVFEVGVVGVADEGVEAGVGGHARQGVAQAVGGDAVGGKVDGEVEDVGLGVVAGGERGEAHQRAAHEGAAPDLAGDQVAADRFGIGTGDGADGDLQSSREVAVGRHACAGCEIAGCDRVGDRFGDGNVAGTAALGDIGRPGCHGDNNYIDAISESNYVLFTHNADDLRSFGHVQPAMYQYIST